MLTVKEIRHRKGLAVLLKDSIFQKFCELNYTVFWSIEDVMLKSCSIRFAHLMAFFDNVTPQEIIEMDSLVFASIVDYTTFCAATLDSDCKTQLMKFLDLKIFPEDIKGWIFSGE